MLASEIIDMVEHDIRRANPDVDEIAMNKVVKGEIEGEEDEHPNTLLYGEDYYQLEDAIAEKLRKAFSKKKR